MRARVLLLPVLVLGACRAEAPAARTGAGAWASPGASPPAGPGDAIVATVDSRPVWGSCVAAQLARGGRSRRAALDECIDFELLAQAAEARGLGRAPDPELERARRAAMVGRLVETGFEDRYRTPADLGATLDRAVDALADQLDQPEFRASAFARVEVPAGAGQRVTHGDFRAATREAVVPPYAAALFSIPEVGRIAAPARTKWGWDVILLTGLIPAQLHTREEAAARVFPELRRREF